MADNFLIIFVKNFIPGMVKTRLAEKIGMFLALDVYQELVAYTSDVVSKADADKMVFYSEYVEVEDMFQGEDTEYNIQSGNSLGGKMQNAFQHAFDRGYSRVTIIGSDCHELEPKHLEEAFDQLEINDVVVGPAKDGGYYLLGLNGPCPALFEGKEYSHEKVFDELMAEIKNLELECHTLETLNDIDTLEDMKDTPLMQLLDEPGEEESDDTGH
ncbi:MAG: glycosyltransferase [Cytophagales bacterium]|nr:glycosyltransferase [Cytophagales bacterium]